MSFCRNNSQQITMNDAMYTITEREEKRLSQSWAKEFGDTIFPIINEERFAALYSSNPASRPNNPVNVYVGLLMLKEMFGQSDEDAIDSLIFDIRYQYALHTTSFEEQPVSKNSLSNLRSAIYEYNEKHDTDILQEEFKSHAKEFSKELQINGKMRRMDSLMVSASCKKMTRLELVYSCVSRLINKIEEIDERKVPKELKEYLGKGHHNEIIYRSRDIEVKDKLDKAMKDAIKLSVLLSDDEIAKTEEYQLLCRMIKDQTEEKEGEHELKPAKEIAPDSLQNPTDKDAVYRRKAGKDHIGYVGNVEEAFDGENSIITHYDLKELVKNNITISGW